MIQDLIVNPSKICKETLKNVHYSYRHPIRQSLIMIEDDMLIFREPIRGSTSYTPLQIVPSGLHDIVFIAFHSNPIGGHLNSYRTLHRLRLRYHWPEMYSFIKHMCNACPGCALSNPTRSICWQAFWIRGQQGIPYRGMWNDWLLCYGTNPTCNLVIFCIRYHENPTSTWLLPHYHPGQGS